MKKISNLELQKRNEDFKLIILSLVLESLD